MSNFEISLCLSLDQSLGLTQCIKCQVCHKQDLMMKMVASNLAGGGPSTCFQVVIFLLGVNIFILAVYNTSGRFSLNANVITSHPPPLAYSDRPTRPLVPATSSVKPELIGTGNRESRMRQDYRHLREQIALGLQANKITIPEPKPKSAISLRQLSSSQSDEFRSFESLMEHRSDRIKNYCKERRVLTSIHAFNNIFLMKDNNILWCPVFKASSSTWLHHLLEISKIPEESSTA